MKTLSLEEMLQRLIGAASVSSVNPAWDMGNGNVIEHLEGWLNQLGFKTEVVPIPGHADKFNLIASAGQGDQGLVLSGHTDTVPFDEEKWQSDPLQLRQRDQRFYGIGSADMKGFFAVVIEALRELPLRQLKQPLVIVATADEESTMCGAKSLADLHRRLGRHAMIGEPTGMRPVHMHKGISMESIRLSGRSGHSSDPALGVNALDGMHRVLGEVIRWRSDLQRRYQNPAFAVAFPTLNLGHIHGGDNPNRICGQCELQFDLRPLPGMALEELRDELRQRLNAILLDSELNWELTPVFDGIPAMETPREAAIVRAVERLTGTEAGAVAFGTEGPYLNSMGMETVICGPGCIDQAHQPDEYLPLKHIQPAINLIQSLVRQFCL
ncbi:MAG: acetylornithine deacetylase [Candidatus Thiodiazotropha sp.]|nr:acetylornithine deacetylase [Candidatus Thiodiazotropha taylori]MBT3058214.1 acetylornithine deacetylase [Candidatus Thiodiazotropha sp. (ex Lucina pensylvanica)]MBT3062794.1 acetylornithine deacetylase [Candidatus Thiodiazotropha sp. (ex Lucina pensylvanica)]PUB75693.1 MAG: acetylornithine deacetylase [gamma proteobacterium symbiont of Ctena orbiculata]PUB77364.1 MAG: acetylornithine deacetylase [gamma proteobacterium symbiont of Ctena orbiculata]